MSVVTTVFPSGTSHKLGLTFKFNSQFQEFSRRKVGDLKKKIQSEMEVAPCSKLFVLLSLLPPLTPIKLIKQPRSKNAIMPAIK